MDGRAQFSHLFIRVGLDAWNPTRHNFGVVNATSIAQSSRTERPATPFWSLVVVAGLTFFWWCRALHVRSPTRSWSGHVGVHIPFSCEVWTWARAGGDYQSWPARQAGPAASRESLPYPYHSGPRVQLPAGSGRRDRNEGKLEGWITWTAATNRHLVPGSFATVRR